MTRAPDPDEQASARRAMLRAIEAHARETAGWTGRRQLSADVLDAMARVPRHEFVPLAERERAYADAALPLGCGQTISQPFIVALMTDLAGVEESSVVLEVGTGCGYQSAVLAELVRRVYTVELLPELGEEARARLARLGYTNVEVRIGDGSEGWPEHAPFDAILVTAAAREIPVALPEQLRPGGRLVIPVGGGFGQELRVMEKAASGALEQHDVLPVAFVPLRRCGGAD